MNYTEEAKKLIYAHIKVVIKTLKEENKKLKEENITDSLTKANNRNFYDKNLAGIVNDCFENKKNVGFLMIDLNDFKWINDNYKSHTVGDMILKDFVHLIYSVIPSTDYVIRISEDKNVDKTYSLIPSKTHVKRNGINKKVDKKYPIVTGTTHVIRMGGDEFLLVLPDADENTGENLNNRLQKIVDLYNKEGIKKRLNEGERVEGKESEDDTYKLSFTSAYLFFSEKLPLKEIYKKVDRKMYLKKDRIKKQISPKE